MYGLGTARRAFEHITPQSRYRLTEGKDGVKIRRVGNTGENFSAASRIRRDGGADTPLSVAVDVDVAGSTRI